MISLVWVAALVTLSLEPVSPESGLISGHLQYPGCMGPPADLVVCAESVTSGEHRCTNDFKAGEDGISYQLEVPAGKYTVYASSAANHPGRKAYFSRAVECGLSVDCQDHEPIVVVVEAGSKIAGIHPADWFAPEKEELFTWKR